MLKAAAAFLVLFSLSASVSAADTCTNVCSTTFDPPIRTVEEPVRWQVVGCRPVYDLTMPEEPLVAWDAIEDVIADDHLKFLPPYFEEWDRNEKVLLGGEWVRIDDTAIWDQWFGLGNAKTSPCAGMM